MNNSTQTKNHSVTELLQFFGISAQGIARQLGGSQFTVSKVLDASRCQGVRHGTTLVVRERVVKLLRAAGWKGDEKKLWAEHDAHNTTLAA